MAYNTPMNALRPHSRRILLIFVDGLGIGPMEPAHNPLADLELQALAPLRLLSGHDHLSVPGFAARRLDACLGVPGIPQSATGQTALFTGVNAAALLGRHLSGLPNQKLRETIRKESIFLKLARMGIPGSFANAFTPAFFPHYERGRLSVTTWCTLAGGRPLKTLGDLRRGRAVYQDFTNLHLQMQGHGLQLQSAQAAGRTLAALASRESFTLYEYFLTDLAGHTQDRTFVRLILQLLDHFLTAALESLDLSQVTAVLTSDHGNVEDLGTRSHTLNPVPLMAWGPLAQRIVAIPRSLVDVTPALLRPYRNQASRADHLTG